MILSLIKSQLFSKIFCDINTVGLIYKLKTYNYMYRYNKMTVYSVKVKTNLNIDLGNFILINIFRYF